MLSASSRACACHPLRLAPGARAAALRGLHPAAGTAATRAGPSPPCRHRAGTSTTSSSGRVRMAASGQQGSGGAMEWPPTLVLAGFYIEELATVRQLLDQIGGEDVRVVPATPALLHTTVAEALRWPEPQWDQPVPPDWQHGGGWGQQRMVLIAGLEPEGAGILMDLFDDAEMPPVCPAYVTAANAGAPLGDVLAAALKQWRSSGGGGSSSGGVMSPAAAVQFVEELPPAQAVVPQEAWQPDGASGSSSVGAGSGGQRVRQAAASAPPEVVQAEFLERPAKEEQHSAAAAAAAAAADVPLDIIDAIATGVPATAEPLSEAAGAGADMAGGPADDDLESMESEELLRAARAALGLDSAELQRLVDEAAAKAAAAVNVPFEGGSIGASGGPAASWSPTMARPAASSGSRKPWETAPVAGGSSSAGSSSAGASSAGAAAAAPSKGFGPAAAPSRKAAKKAQKQAGKHSSGSTSGGAAGQPAVAAAAPEPTDTPSAGTADTAAAGGSEAAPDSSSKGEEGSSKASEEGHILPPVDQFVLSRAQLRAVTEKHGLDFEELMRGVEERGIHLAD